MPNFAKYELWPTADLANLIQALALAGQSMPAEYAAGWVAALEAVATATGATRKNIYHHVPAPPTIVDVVPYAPAPIMLHRDDPEPRRSEPSSPCRVFDGIEDVPCAISAFAHLGR